MPKISPPPVAPAPKEEAGATTGSGTMPKAASVSGSMITAEVVETTETGKETIEPVPIEDELKTEPIEDVTPAVVPPKPAAPEVPSFDDSAASKIGTEAELGELSEFFKDAKKKPAAPEPPPARMAPPPPPPARPARPAPPAPPEPKEPIDLGAGEALGLAERQASASASVSASASASASRSGKAEEAEDSVSQIKIKSVDTSHPSEFNPNFNQPVFPDFGSGSSGEVEKSDSDSAISRPFEADKSKVIISGVADLVIYALIAAVFVAAGSLAGAVTFKAGASFIFPLAIVILAVIWFYQVFFISVLGQTPGQMIARIEVLDKSGHRISIAKASVRALVYLVCLIPAGIGFIPSLLGSSIPDKAAGTKPVKW
jgi:uncharacterized RDD family membrane protein YckC